MNRLHERTKGNNEMRNGIFTAVMLATLSAAPLVGQWNEGCLQRLRVEPVYSAVLLYHIVDFLNTEHFTANTNTERSDLESHLEGSGKLENIQEELGFGGEHPNTFREWMYSKQAEFQCLRKVLAYERSERRALYYGLIKEHKGESATDWFIGSELHGGFSRGWGMICDGIAPSGSPFPNNVIPSSRQYPRGSGPVVNEIRSAYRNYQTVADRSNWPEPHRKTMRQLLEENHCNLW